MSSIAIYVEGGGVGASRGQLRIGMDAFLRSVKEMARRAGHHWKLVACGSRNDAFDAFQNALATNPTTTNILLVDSEEPVTGSPTVHLAARDPWPLHGIDEDRVHLMVCVMESWIVADPDAMAAYYGQRFKKNVLPAQPDIEQATKAQVNAALQAATKDTQKGPYHKTRHAPDLLGQIDAGKVRLRSRHCDRLSSYLASVAV